MERAVFPLLFGCIHAILIDNLFVQTVVLFIIEIAYFGTKIGALRSKTTRYKFKAVVCAVVSMLRLIFIATFYIYEEKNHPAIMNLVHHDVVGLYLISWIVEFIHDIFVFCFEVKDAVTMKCRAEETSKAGKEEQVMKKSKSDFKLKPKSSKEKVDAFDKIKINVKTDPVLEKKSNIFDRSNESDRME